MIKRTFNLGRPAPVFTPSSAAFCWELGQVPGLKIPLPLFDIMTCRCLKGHYTPENLSRIEWTNCHTFQWQFVCSIRNECQFVSGVDWQSANKVEKGFDFNGVCCAPCSWARRPTCTSVMKSDATPCTWQPNTEPSRCWRLSSSKVSCSLRLSFRYMVLKRLLFLCRFSRVFLSYF